MAPAGRAAGPGMRRGGFSLLLVPMVFVAPARLFVRITQGSPTPLGVMFKYALWVGMVPPLCAFWGASRFGWRFGVGEPISMGADMLAAICVAYYLMLLAGFVVASLVALWMRPSYAGESTAGECFALIAVVGTPMALGGILHLYPHAVLNVAALTPAFLWSVRLLYTGLPVVLRNGPERGMLMASSVLGFVLTALAAFMTLILISWANGFGPSLGL